MKGRSHPLRQALALAALIGATAAHAAGNTSVFDLTPDAAGEQVMREKMRLPAEARLSYENAEGKAISFAEYVALIKASRSVSMRKSNEGRDIALSPGKPRELDINLFDARSAPKLKIADGQPLPDFKLRTLDGKSYDKAALAGRYTVLSFFFEACAPCVAEVPSLNRFKALHPELHLLALTFDDEKRAQRFQDRHKLDWPVVIESLDFNKTLGVGVYPSMILLDPQGRVLGFKVFGNKLSPDEDAGRAEHAALAAWVKALIEKSQQQKAS